MKQTLLKSTQKHLGEFNIGDRVTCKSIPARSMLLGVPQVLELATYPSLIGVELTIESFDGQFIICTRESGSYGPVLVAEDLELMGVGA